MSEEMAAPEKAVAAPAAAAVPLDWTHIRVCLYTASTPDPCGGSPEVTGETDPCGGSVLLDQSASALQNTKRKLDEILTDDPLTQHILDMKHEQARLKKRSRNSDARLKFA